MDYIVGGWDSFIELYVWWVGPDDNHRGERKFATKMSHADAQAVADRLRASGEDANIEPACHEPDDLFPDLTEEDERQEELSAQAESRMWDKQWG